MKCIFFIAIMVYCFPLKNFAQPIMIYGKVFEYKSLLPLGLTNIQVLKGPNTFSDRETGEFFLDNNTDSLIDSILITYLGYRPTLLINIPHDRDTLFLNQIPLFETGEDYSMVDFFCGPLNILCKIQERRYWKKENQRVDKIRSEVDKQVNSCRYLLNGKIYKLEIKNGFVLIDLSKSLGKHFN
jgi:hypothetical protein